MSVGRICVREVDVVAPDESVQVAAGRMNSRQVGTLVVVNAAGEPTGIITDRDLAVRVVAQAKDAATTTVGEIMQGPLRTVGEQTPIEDALRIMRSGPFRRIPVVDDAGKLLGLLSLDDILGLLAEEFASISELLEAEQPQALARM